MLIFTLATVAATIAFPPAVGLFSAGASRYGCWPGWVVTAVLLAALWCRTGDGWACSVGVVVLLAGMWGWIGRVRKDEARRLQQQEQRRRTREWIDFGLWEQELEPAAQERMEKLQERGEEAA
jgi:polyferredoxin